MLRTQTAEILRSENGKREVERRRSPDIPALTSSSKQPATARGGLQITLVARARNRLYRTVVWLPG